MRGEVVASPRGQREAERASRGQRLPDDTVAERTPAEREAVLPARVTREVRNELETGLKNPRA